MNLYEIRKAPGESGAFFKAVQKQKPAQYQGLYLVEPDGKVLASHQDYKSEKNWSHDLLADLKPGLRTFGAVEPREFKRIDPLPQRGIGTLADGGVCLGIYLRYSIRGIPYREIPNPTIDSLVLTAAEWKALAPPMIEADHEWTINKDVGRKFCRVLGPGDENTMPRPNEVKYVLLTGKVQSIKNGIAHIAYTGKIAGAHQTQSNRGLCHGEAQLTGTGRYDVKTGRMLALIWVFDGVFRNVTPHDEPAKYSGVVEWRQEPR